MKHFIILFCIGCIPTEVSERNGILPFDNGNAVVICGEAITLNDNSSYSEEQLKARFDVALETRRKCMHLKYWTSTEK